MADLLGEVAGSLGPQCETATAASVLSSFQEGHFLSAVSAKDKPFFESFVQTHAFLAYLQTLHLFGTSESPFAEALRSLGHRKPLKGKAFALPEPPIPRASICKTSTVCNGAMIRTSEMSSSLLELHLRCPSSDSNTWPVGESKVLASVFHEVMPKDGYPKGSSNETVEMNGILAALEAAGNETCDDRHLWEKLANDLHKAELKGLEISEVRWSLVLLYAVLCRKMGASMEFLLKVHLTIDRPAALPTHSILSLMNGIDPHRLSDVLVEADGARAEDGVRMKRHFFCFF